MFTERRKVRKGRKEKKGLAPRVPLRLSVFARAILIFSHLPSRGPSRPAGPPATRADMGTREGPCYVWLVPLGRPLRLAMPPFFAAY